MVKVLYTNQSAQWRFYLHRLPAYLGDIHYQPEMMLPYEEAGLGRGMLAVVEQYDNFMIQPLLKMNDGVLRHPYNFGGPLATEYFKPEGLPFPCEGILNPFLAKWQLPFMMFGGNRPEFIKETVWIDLTQPFELRDDIKYRIRKAEQAGVVVQRAHPSTAYWKAFYDLYSNNMDRLEADDHWRFSPEWFSKFLWHLKDHSSLMYATMDNKIVGGCVLLHGYGTCYYHFSACERSKHGISHKLLMSAAEWAKEQGYHRFHLGGGITPDDSLFVFKSGFSNRRLPVYKYEAVNEYAEVS